MGSISLWKMSNVTKVDVFQSVVYDLNGPLLGIGNNSSKVDPVLKLD